MEIETQASGFCGVREDVDTRVRRATLRATRRKEDHPIVQVGVRLWSSKDAAIEMDRLQICKVE